MSEVDSTITIENWKQVVGYESTYEISDLGRVRRIQGTKYYNANVPVLSPWKNLYGYRQVTLSKKPKKYHPYVHILVWQAFVGPTATGMEVNHKDLNKENNRLENLELITKLENIRHATINGAQKPRRGKLNGMAKLTDDQIKEIRAIRPPDEPPNTRHVGETSLDAIAKKYGVHPSLIWSIIKRKTWRHIA